jgi:hypothetical protein
VYGVLGACTILRGALDELDGSVAVEHRVHAPASIPGGRKTG